MVDSRGWFFCDDSRKQQRRWKGRGSLCSCNGTATDHVLSEQNRGPLASKPPKIHNNNAAAECHSFKKMIHNNASSYNNNVEEDFVTEYKDAKFFVIKSYSEDNIHKSIKYGIWASTPNGNRKLDTAYQEANNDRGGGDCRCLIFFLFSVNASAQFCGVAEMVGPVDFSTSFDYWQQQDKWIGQFPVTVRWHIIKDVPNSQFRHIILVNNDNKPVTNSRDTQEVKLEQGIEMLDIFKNYKTDRSILDDFGFYEERQKVIQGGKSRQEEGSSIAAASASAVGVVIGAEQSSNNNVTLSIDFIHKMSKSFAQVVHLNNKQGNQKDAPPASVSMTTRFILFYLIFVEFLPSLLVAI